jgi:hypothetical protein
MLVNGSHESTTLVNGMAPCSLRSEERNTRASDDLIVLLAISRLSNKNRQVEIGLCAGVLIRRSSRDLLLKTVQRYLHV